MSEEQLSRKIVKCDIARRTRALQKWYHDTKISLVNNFGAGTITRGLDAFHFFSSAAIAAYPSSEAAETSPRLSYFSGAVVAISLDYITASVSFRAAEERAATLTNAIRFGDMQENEDRIRIAMALIERYAPNGKSLARNVEVALKQDIDNFPADLS